MRREDRFPFIVWLSGFFGAGAFIHGLRVLLRYPVVINEMNVTLEFSVVSLAVFTVLSGVTAYLAYMNRLAGK